MNPLSEHYPFRPFRRPTLTRDLILDVLAVAISLSAAWWVMIVLWAVER